MKKLLMAIVAAASIDAGEVQVDTGPLSQTEIAQFRRAKFSQLADKMEERMPQNYKCHSLFNDEQETALFECSAENQTYAALFVWQKDQWTKTPGVFTD